MYSHFEALSPPHAVANPSFSLDSVHTLAQKGYTPQEYKVIRSIESTSAKRDYLEKNLATTVNHVFEDSAVSFTCHYQLNKEGRVVSYPDGVVLNIDPDERGGLNAIGIESAVWGALENPYKAVLLYSPPGPVVFDDNPQNKFREIKPYHDGQLYIMYSDGQKVSNVSLSISSEGEEWISRIMPNEYQKANTHKSAIDRVKYFITNPLLTGKNIDDFLQEQSEQDERPVYRNKDGEVFSLHQTLGLIRQSLAGKLEQSPIVRRILSTVNIETVTASDIDRIYGALAQQYMQERGIQRMTLGGSCGGTEITLDPFSSLMNNLSTSFRRMVQGIQTPHFSKPTQEISTMKFEHKPGHTCNKCGTSGESVELGPCDICQACQKRFDSGEFK